MALVGNGAGFGETLVNGSEPSHGNKKTPLVAGQETVLAWDRSVGVRGVDGAYRNAVLNVNRSAVLSSLLGLELHFQQFDFLLLLHQSHLGLHGCGGSRLSLALLAVQDQAGEQVAADADELRVAVVVPVALGLTGSPVASGLAVAAGSAGFFGDDVQDIGVAVTGGGIAEAVDAAGVGGEVLSVGCRSSKGENRSGDEQRGKGESVEFHGS